MYRGRANLSARHSLWTNSDRILHLPPLRHPDNVLTRSIRERGNRWPTGPSGDATKSLQLL